MGVKGWIAFEKTVKYIKENYPDQFIIADAKRGDIGNTSAMYARTFFDELDIDSVTVAPYMGEESVTSPSPELMEGSGQIPPWHQTSNKGSDDFQSPEDPNGERLFEKSTGVVKWVTTDMLRPRTGDGMRYGVGRHTRRRF